MNKIIFIDTETNGLPTFYDSPASDIGNWPRLVQLAYIIYDNNRNIIEEQTFIIKPEGFTISSESTAIHGITNVYANEHGHKLYDVINTLKEKLTGGSIIVGHNIQFDLDVICAEMYRLGAAVPLSQLFKNDMHDEGIH